MRRLSRFLANIGQCTDEHRSPKVRDYLWRECRRAWVELIKERIFVPLYQRELQSETVWGSPSPLHSSQCVGTEFLYPHLHVHLGGPWINSAAHSYTETHYSNTCVHLSISVKSIWYHWVPFAEKHVCGYELNPVSFLLLTICGNFLSCCTSEHERRGRQMILFSGHFMWEQFHPKLPVDIMCHCHIIWHSHSPLSQSDCLQRAFRNDLIPGLAALHN